MSASFLHYTQGVRRVKYKSTRYIAGSIIITAVLKQIDEVCPVCKSTHLHFKDALERQLQMCPIGKMPSWLHLKMRRRQCADCFFKWRPQPAFISGQRRMVRSFERYIIRLTASMTLQDVARLLGLSWHTVRDIHKEYLKKKYSKPFPFETLIYLGIDEFSIGKNHDYMSIFINLETGQIIHAVEGRSRDAIIPFLKKIAKKAINLKAISMDMSGPYKSAVTEILPSLDIVFDRFHVMKLINKAIDEIRREQHRLYKAKGNDVLKGSRYLLLRNIESLDPSQRNSLEQLLAMNAPLAFAHLMKEQLRGFWTQLTKTDAELFLLRWILSVRDEYYVPELAKVARTLLYHHFGLTSYFKHRISNGTTEGVNNKIETLKRQAYGYRDMEYFKLRLYHLHTQKSELVG
jgi:transposase